MGTANLTAGGIGVILALIVAVQIWKQHGKGSPGGGKKPPGKLAFLAGLFASGTVMSWLGGLAFSSIAGVAFTTVVLVVGGVVAYHEVIKGNGHHLYRTPVIAFAVGVALTATFAGVHSMVQHTGTQLTTVIHTGTGK